MKNQKENPISKVLKEIGEMDKDIFGRITMTEADFKDQQTKLLQAVVELSEVLVIEELQREINLAIKRNKTTTY